MSLKRVLEWHKDGAIAIISLIIFPVILVFFIVLYQIDPNVYIDVLTEDGIVEYLTFVFFVLAGLLSFWILRRQFNISHWLYLALGLFCIFSALEEISWGQRIFGFESPYFFVLWSKQNEINIHGIIQQRLHILFKHVAGIVCVIYGVLFPVLNRYKRIDKFFNRVHFIIPPLYLIPGFILSAILMIDIPTTFEEEIGELFISLCLLLFTAARTRTRQLVRVQVSSIE